jgi:hypothetical protein
MSKPTCPDCDGYKSIIAELRRQGSEIRLALALPAIATPKEILTKIAVQAAANDELVKTVERINSRNQELGTQIAVQAELLKRCLDIIDEVALTPAYDGRGDCCYCGRHKGHDTDCGRKKAQALGEEVKI